MLKLATFIGTFGYSGCMKKAPGTWGTLAALPVCWPVHLFWGWQGLALLALIFFLSGWWAAHVYMEHHQKHDPKEIVMDEAAGIALLLCMFELSLVSYAVAFVLFRLFDILKPWPISVADKRLHNAFGVMFDDILAALYPMFIGIVIAWFMDLTPVYDIFRWIK